MKSRDTRKELREALTNAKPVFRPDRPLLVQYEQMVEILDQTSKRVLGITVQRHYDNPFPPELKREILARKQLYRQWKHSALETDRALYLAQKQKIRLLIATFNRESADRFMENYNSNSVQELTHSIARRRKFKFGSNTQLPNNPTTIQQTEMYYRELYDYPDHQQDPPPTLTKNGNFLDPITVKGMIDMYILV